MKTMKAKSSRRHDADLAKEIEDDRRSAANARIMSKVTDAQLRQALKRAAALRAKASDDDINGE